MSNTLQIEVDPFLCASQRRYFEGEVTYQQMPRLQEDIEASTKPLDAKLEFSKEGKFILLTARIKGTLVLQCAACLEEMDFPIDINVRLVLINDESLFGVLPEEYEPRVIEGDRVLLSSIVEDEIVLALPYIARHDVCPVELPMSSASDNFVIEKEVKTNPFKVLEDFKKN